MNSYLSAKKNDLRLLVTPEEIRGSLSGRLKCNPEEIDLAVAIASNPKAGFVACTAEDEVAFLCLFIAHPVESACLLLIPGKQSIEVDVVRLLQPMRREARQRFGKDIRVYIQTIDAGLAGLSEDLIPHRAVTIVQLDDFRGLQLKPEYLVQDRNLGDDKFWEAFTHSQSHPGDCFDRQPNEVRAWSVSDIPGRTLMALAISARSGSIIGTALPYVQGGIGWCEGISVHPNFRRQKVGSALICAAVNRLLKLGAQAVRANVDRMTNPTSAALFQKLGFAEVACSYFYLMK